MTEADSLRISFRLRGIDGLIDVSVTRNVDPEAIGYTVLSWASVSLVKLLASLGQRPWNRRSGTATSTC
jgi:hypothetical protein